MNIVEGNVYHMDYMDSKGNCTRRTVKVLTRKPTGFLTECAKRRDVRLFRFDRILKIHAFECYKGDFGFTPYGEEAA